MTDYPSYIHCRSCGVTEHLTYGELDGPPRPRWQADTMKLLHENRWCFHCAYWERRAAKTQWSREQYVKGAWPSSIVVYPGADPFRAMRGGPGQGTPMIYGVGDEQAPHVSRGYGGAKFVIQLDDGRRMASSNLWSGTDIPELRQNDPRFTPIGYLVSFERDPRDYEAEEIALRTEFDRLIKERCYYSDTGRRADARFTLPDVF